MILSEVTAYNKKANTPVIQRGEWGVIEGYAKFDVVGADEGGEGIVRAWYNGELIGEVATPTMAAPTDRVGSALLHTYWNGGAPQTQNSYIDAIRATTQRPAQQDSQGNWMIGL